MKKIFDMVFVLIYICNIAEIMKKRIDEANKKEDVGIELIQLMLVCIYTVSILMRGI